MGVKDNEAADRTGETSCDGHQYRNDSIIIDMKIKAIINKIIMQDGNIMGNGKQRKTYVFNTDTSIQT